MKVLVEKIMPDEKRKFTLPGDNRGLLCPFERIVCEEGDCRICKIYADWQKKGEILVICAWCSKVLEIKPAYGNPGVSHGLCPECQEKHFPKAIG